MSYKKVVARKDRIAARFLGQVHSAISNAAALAKMDAGLTQRKIAQELGVDKSVISRILKGAGNPTIRTVGEIAAALGYRPELVLHKVDLLPGRNEMNVIARGNDVVVGQRSTKTISENFATVSYSPGRENKLECASR